MRRRALEIHVTPALNEMNYFKFDNFSDFNNSSLVISCTPTKNIGLLDKPKTYTPVSKELFDTIAQMDSVVFDAAIKVI